MIKKLSLLFFICILSTLNINAEVYEGSCGTNVRYSLDTETGLLSITGTGAMTNYTSSSSVPWDSYRSYIKTVEISDGLSSIGEKAFRYCSNLTSVIIPNSVTGIGRYAFADCTSLTSVKISDNLTSIEQSTFESCSSLTSITVPNSVTSIIKYAFRRCTSLTSVVLGNNVTSIGNDVFSGCSSLTDMYSYAENIPTTDYEAFNSQNLSTSTLHVPVSALEAYKTTAPWNQFGTIEAILDGVLRGDANGDGEVNTNDADFIVDYMLGTPAVTFNKEAADANQDGEIGMPDVMYIINHNLNGKFPEEKEKSMVLHHSDGTESLIELSTKPLIKFLDDKVQITTNVSQKEYSQDDILSITYKDDETIETNIGIASGTIGKAFYIYRNDGEFNAFFRDEVDSITYSCYDLNNKCHKCNVTQHVYTTDSLYRIPLAVIDSIGFVQPETVFSSDVFPLTAEHVPYIVDADTLRFTMLESTPSHYRPKIGNIVVGTAECTNFPDGIIAKIININKISEGYNYQCESASYDDVFEQLVICSRESASEASRSRSAVPRVNASLSLDAELWNVNWSQTIEGGGTSTVLNVGDRMTVKVTARKTLKTPLYFQVEMQNALTSSINFTAESSMGYFAQKQIGKTISAGRIVIPNTANLLWFVPKLSLYGYFQEEGKVELKYGGHLNRTDKVSFTYNKGKWTFNHTPLTDVGLDIAQLSMEGYAEVGLMPQVDFSLNGRRAGLGFRASVGLKEYINFVFDTTKLSDGGLYDAMRDSYCRTTFPWSLTAHANADIIGKYNSNYTDVGPVTYSGTFTPRTEPQWGKDRYIFPLFNNVEANRQDINKTTATAKSQIERSPLLPIQVGFSLLDKDNNIVQTKYDSRTYKEGSLFSNYSIDFTDVKTSEDYTVRPSVKLMGYDILASPLAELETKEETSCPDSNHPHWIDLGLPSGTLWRCCNEGASTPEAYGDYYIFGQVSSAPTLEQIQELVSNCKYEWTTQNGVTGGKLKGPNGGTIFLPAAGRRWNGDLYYVGSACNCWSSTPGAGDPSSAYNLCFYSGSADWHYVGRDNGYSVRPVR